MRRAPTRPTQLPRTLHAPTAPALRTTCSLTTARDAPSLHRIAPLQRHMSSLSIAAAPRRTRYCVGYIGQQQLSSRALLNGERCRLSSSSSSPRRIASYSTQNDQTTIIQQALSDGKDALRKGNLGQATIDLTSAYKTLLENSDFVIPLSRDARGLVFRALASTYLSQEGTKHDIIELGKTLLHAISKNIDKSLDKPTIVEGLLLDIISAVVRTSLPLEYSIWMPIFIRLTAVQNTVHQKEALVAASVLGSRLHVLEPDLQKAKQVAERGLESAKENTRYQAEIHASIGDVELARGDLAAARAAFERSLSLIAPSQRPASAAKDKPETFAVPDEALVDFVADTRCKIGKIAVQQKEWRVAEDNLGDAIKNVERVYGRGSVRVAGLLQQVALLYAARGSVWDTYAEGLFKKALSIHEEHAMCDQTYLSVLQDYHRLLSKNPARSAEMQHVEQQIEKVRAKLGGS